MLDDNIYFVQLSTLFLAHEVVVLILGWGNINMQFNRSLPHKKNKDISTVIITELYKYFFFLAILSILIKHPASIDVQLYQNAADV